MPKASRSRGGGSVVQRPSLFLTTLLLVVSLGYHSLAVAQAPQSQRVTLPEGSAGSVDLRADDIATWVNGDERIIALGRNATIRQGRMTLETDWAIVWVKMNQPGTNGSEDLTIYAGSKVKLGFGDKTTEYQALLADWKTLGKLNLPRSKVQEKSAADSPQYKEALAARLGKSVAVNPSTVGTEKASVILPATQVQYLAAEDPKTEPIPPVAAQPTQLPPPKSVDPTPGPGGTRSGQAPPIGNEPPVFETPLIPLPPINTRILKIASRTQMPFNGKFMNMGNGEQVGLFTGGIKILAQFPEKNGLVLDIVADQIVLWQTGGENEKLADSIRERDEITAGNDKHIELYLSGNVEIRYGTKSDIKQADGAPVDTKIFRADQMYYDVTKNKALGLNAELEFSRQGLADTTHFFSNELMQLSQSEFKAKKSSLNASKLPSDPGLKMTIAEAVIYEQKGATRQTIFGTAFRDRDTGEEIEQTERTFEATSATVRLSDIPVFYFPYLEGDANDPLGPLSAFNFRQDTILGYQFYTTWDVLELLGIRRLPGEHWGLMLDYLTNRGPGFGTNYERSGQTMFGEEAPFYLLFKAYGVYDHGTDTLGGPRQNDFQPTALRDRILFKYQQQYENWTIQAQVAHLSDRNFLEQYYNYDFNQGNNQETAVHLKYQEGSGAATVLLEPNFDRSWVTETQWLPKLDGYWLGQSLLWDSLNYNTWGSAAYANMKAFNLPASEYPAGFDPTTLAMENSISTGRFDWYQQVSAPVSLGFLKVVPYGNVDLTYYTQDLNGDARGRVYGGLGSRANTQLSRLYGDVESEFLNINGLNHKISLNANYYNAWSDTPSSLLPQLDRLNDDASQQSVRDMKPNYLSYNPGPAGYALTYSQLYDPRLYAIRRLVDTRVDTLDSIQVLQLGVNQRLQTKRGYEGAEHTVDWLTLDVSASIFPEKNRDNFGHTVSFVEYNGMWAVGDRNGFTSSGWFDPFDTGTRYWNIASYYNRPDGTNFNLSYRQLQPVNSRLISGSIGYSFSPKYSISYTASLDIGLNTGLSQNLAVTRVGSDLTVSAGFSYNALINNFGFNFIVVPNLLASKGVANMPIAINGQSAQYTGR